jgi:hypothetical protein
MARKTDDAGEPADEKTTTFVPAETFTGWPLGYEANRRGVVFTKGVESEPVPESEKGLVAATAADTAAEAPAT